MKAVWISEHDYLGCLGADNVREMAELVHADIDAFDSLDLSINPTIDEVEARLNLYGVHPVIVPIPIFRQESWDGAWVFPCAQDAKPGRGYVKVLGVHL